MSLYKIYKYIEHIPAVLGIQKEEPDERDKEFMNRQPKKIESNEELINQAKELGLKTPKKWSE